MIIEFSTSHPDNIELSPMLVLGPIIVFDSITQFLPSMTGPVILQSFLIIVP
jgi:hypothetical protein